MKTTMRTLLALALLTLTACDYIDRRTFRKERHESDYRAAMEDYRAGRLESAVAKLKELCAADPANASARFQLACLLQDSVHDYAGAYCAYREYLAQRGSSDKTHLAKDRLAACEKELARVLADKYHLNAAGAQAKAAEGVRAELTASEARAEKAAQDLSTAQQRLLALGKENERLKALLADGGETEGADDAVAPAGEIADAKQIFKDDEAESEAASAPTEEIGSVKKILAEADKDDETVAPPIAPVAPVAEKKDRPEKKHAKDKLPPPPPTYVVQEGDSLYKIAVRFYGKSSAWSRIREANKATISTDGRVRVGQKITLPPQP